MSKIVYNPGCEECYPHASDVLEREFAENGFAKGWAPHCKPVPKYYFDNHVHYSGGKDNLHEHLYIPENLYVKRAIYIFQIWGKNRNETMENESLKNSGFRYFTIDELKERFSDHFENNKYYWSAYLNYLSPEPELIRAAVDMGVKCIKLHNAPQIESNAPLDLWYSQEWQACFEVIAEHKLPVLWHVTQRLPSSNYTEGGRNVYWKNGWKNGVTYNNEDLLQVFLTKCRRYPDINFIGAHQLHVGWERLDELFTAHHNLYVDTTIGCQLRLDDDFYPHDKEFLRAVFIKWSDRIIFGTDTFGKYEEDNYRRHIRFITALDLPQNALDNICYKNIERLCGIK
jgi:predicted TIM-barrel fold metal-dependent hydrolase